MLDKLVSDQPALPIKQKGIRGIREPLPAEIQFRGWTNDGNVRHPSYKGLRADEDAVEVCKLS